MNERRCDFRDLAGGLDEKGHRGSRTRLLLCGAAMSFMGRLLSGNAPLRGRAGIELLAERHQAESIPHQAPGGEPPLPGIALGNRDPR